MGVSESADQYVHINDTPGFNIGAAGQPPNCRNSLHSHTTAEVFFVLKGRWRFFWGRWGDAGEVTLEEGDIINIPTGIFRGFENIGTDYGMIMAVLGGDDAGGGVVWAPQVIQDAAEHGLVLGKNGKLYDTQKRGYATRGRWSQCQSLMKQLSKTCPNQSRWDIIPRHVARYLDLNGDWRVNHPLKLWGEDAILPDKPGFDIEFITRGSLER